MSHKITDENLEIAVNKHCSNDYMMKNSIYRTKQYSRIGESLSPPFMGGGVNNN
jgi:hypothetical protein